MLIWHFVIHSVTTLLMLSIGDEDSIETILVPV